jgi:hypothetical protein
MANINNFLTRVLANGVQRTNRYRCLLDVGPLGLSEYGTAASLLREGLLCRTTMTPTRSLETTTVDLSAGYEEKYAVYTAYNDIDCTFLCPLINGKTEVLSLFHAWQNRIQNRGRLNEGESADMVLTFPDTYRLAQGMTLELLSEDKDQILPTASFKYLNVYPLSVGGTTVDWAMQDEMMEVSVTFSFTHWQQVV